MNKYYVDKTAVVTGGASGIGLALSELLLSVGAGAVVMADLNEKKLSEEVERLKAAYPGKVLGIKTDVTSRESVEDMIGRAADFGSGEIHMLFNNAGLGLGKAFDETTMEDWKFAFDVNFYGALYGIKAVLPIMRAQGGGHIANTASGIAFSPMAYQSMYSATKAALVALTCSLRYELWDDNIRFSTIIPGTVATPIWDLAGGPPATAVTPEESARGILKGMAANDRIIFVTDDDRNGAMDAFDYRASAGKDLYFLNNARRRRSGEVNAL